MAAVSSQGQAENKKLIDDAAAVSARKQKLDELEGK
jgi:hypothetical protein